MPSAFKHKFPVNFQPFPTDFLALEAKVVGAGRGLGRPPEPSETLRLVQPPSTRREQCTSDCIK